MTGKIEIWSQAMNGKAKVANETTWKAETKWPIPLEFQSFSQILQSTREMRRQMKC